jgi:MbtH protein
MNFELDTRSYKVVINIEGQYSIWPDEREIPLGWEYAGVKGTKEDCLAYIEAVWTEMYPRRVRKLIEGRDSE